MDADLEPESNFVRGLFLPELRRGLDATAPTTAAGAAAAEHWRAALALDERQFETLLATEGLDREHLARILGDRPAAAAAAADWRSEVRALLDSFSPAAVAAAGFPEEYQFGAALAGFVAPAVAALRARIAPAADFDVDWPAIERTLASHLTNTLAILCERTLVLELNVARLEGRLRGETPPERYRDYVGRVLGDAAEWAKLFDEYAMLARLMSCAIRRWQDALAELFARLAADFPLIAARVLGTSERLYLEKMWGGLSDPHRQGRSVWTLGFRREDAGAPLRVVYKPKSLAVDQHFQALLALCNEAARSGELHLGELRHARPRLADARFPELHLTRVLDRGGHGWVEFIERRECDDAGGPARFYLRQGAYLALLHLLDGVDLHFENVIAHGEQPVLVDLEMLFHPMLAPPGDPADARERAFTRLRNSVLRSGLLPGRFWGDEDRVGVNIGGLGTGEAQVAEAQVWARAHTDEMHEAVRPQTFTPDGHLPKLGGVVCSVLEHTDELVAGFEAMLRFFMDRRAALLAEGGPILDFAGDEVRRVLRATIIYARLLRASLHPDNLRDALDRERLLDMLWPAAQAEPHLLCVTAAEKEDLRLGDFPFFSTRPDSCDLRDSRGLTLPGVYHRSALDAVCERVALLDESTVAEQIFVLRATLSAAAIHQFSRLRSEGAGASEHPMPAESAARAALAIGELLADTAILGERNAAWQGVAYLGRTAFNLVPTGGSLYDGTGGIALFLAHLGHLCREERFTRLAERAALTTRAAIGIETTPSGGFAGVPSELYALAHLAVLWGRPDLLPPLDPILASLAAVAASDARLDVIYGSAGCILALLALHEALERDDALAAAVAYGRNLQARAVRGEAGAYWIGNLSARPLLGFSHGAGGVACALSRLARATADGRYAADARAFAALAEEALRYERSLFDAAAGNWPDLREEIEGGDPAQRFPWAWCHGAPGIALSRVIGFRTGHGSPARAEVETAVEGMLARRILPQDILCHGELGNMMIASHAAAVLGRDDWQRRVDERMAVTLGRMRERGPQGSFEFLPTAPDLMMGTAGIGYGLLYQAFPGQLPDVLALEPPPRATRAGRGAR